MRVPSRSTLCLFISVALIIGTSGLLPASTATSLVTGSAQASASPVPLSQQELEGLLPASVYYLAKTAPVQLRNAGGVRFPGNAYFLTVMVDNSGYASNVQESYQFYLLTEGPVIIGGQRLPAGAYGAGFVDNKLAIMDIGGHPVLETAAQQDASMPRPRPMQVLGDTATSVKLYHGRQWVSVAPAPAIAK